MAASVASAARCRSSIAPPTRNRSRRAAARAVSSFLASAIDGARRSRLFVGIDMSMQHPPSMTLVKFGGLPIGYRRAGWESAILRLSRRRTSFHVHLLQARSLFCAMVGCFVVFDNVVRVELPPSMAGSAFSRSIRDGNAIWDGGTHPGHPIRGNYPRIPALTRHNRWRQTVLTGPPPVRTTSPSCANPGHMAPQAIRIP